MAAWVVGQAAGHLGHQLVVLVDLCGDLIGDDGAESGVVPVRCDELPIAQPGPQLDLQKLGHIGIA